MEQQWIVKSLAVWGMVVAFLTAVVPGINAMWPDLGLTPEWIMNLDTAMKTILTGFGVLVGLVMVAIDRFTGESKKTLVFRNPDKS